MRVCHMFIKEKNLLTENVKEHNLEQTTNERAAIKISVQGWCILSLTTDATVIE